MLTPDSEGLNGGRTVVGIDPCSQFLQLAILTPNKKTEFKKLPLSPSITEEIVRSTDPATTQIAIESYGSYGKLFVYDLLKRGYDIREVNPHISKKMAGLYSEEVIEILLDEELTDHLGFEKYDQKSKVVDNSRNGHTPKPSNPNTGRSAWTCRGTGNPNSSPRS